MGDRTFLSYLSEIVFWARFHRHFTATRLASPSGVTLATGPPPLLYSRPARLAIEPIQP